MNKTVTQPDARTRILDAALKIIREKGYAATRVDDICAEAGLTKGGFFHHFKGKEDMAVAAAEHWSMVTGGLFEQAPYHEPADPLDRILGYVAFRKAIMEGGTADFTCLVGTMAQETHLSNPAIRDACQASIFGHAATLEPDIEEAKAKYCPDAGWTPKSLALFTQATLQGSFILAKAEGGPEIARDMIDHLDRYIRLLFSAGRHQEE